MGWWHFIYWGDDIVLCALIHYYPALLCKFHLLYKHDGGEEHFTQFRVPCHDKLEYLLKLNSVSLDGFDYQVTNQIASLLY